MSLSNTLSISTTEMHTGGEPLRIIESGFPELLGQTVLEKRRYARESFDHLRKFLMHEPRGHYDMYGVLLVEADNKDADFGVIFLHNEGYSTMCGHAMIALGRYAVDRRLVKVNQPETEVKIQCPSGLVRVFVEFDGVKSGRVRFHSVPAFSFATDVEVDVAGYGKVKVDIGYGGTFYAILSADLIGLDVRTASTSSLIRAATAVSDAVKAKVSLSHPDSADLAFLYGTILTDGRDAFSDQASANITVFADKEVDRCPTGSGVTARLAVQYHRGLIKIGQQRLFESGPTGSVFTGQVVREAQCGEYQAIVAEVGGKAQYTGKAVFTVEEDDELKSGFLLR